MTKTALPALASREGGAFCGWTARGGTRHITKTLLVMKLTVFLLTAACLNVAAKGVSQNVTFSGENVALSSVFTSVKDQTGFVFIYTDLILKSAKPVTINASDVPLEEFLSDVFKDQPLAFEITGKNIIISRKLDLPGTSELAPRFFISPPPPIKVRVVDEQGVPLVGASVTNTKIKNTVITDSKGEADLTANTGDIMLITFVGYDKQSVIIKDNSSPLIIILKPASSPLDEVQIIAYGTTTQRLNTGNTFTVKSDDIAKAPVSNPLLALQGRVPGLMITQANGVPGGAITVRIQGNNSILNGNTPFYVIDGVPYLFKNTSPYGNNILGSADEATGSPFNFISPEDIESIDILKDADATAIYGSRAANGAILITTKKGKAGQLKINLDAQTGISQVARRLQMMNTQQYLDMRREAIKNDGITIPSTPDPAYYDLTLYDQNRYTDWQKELIGKTAGYTSAQASVSGGNAILRGLLGVNYRRETNVFPGAFADQKVGAHVNLSGNSNNRKFQFEFTGSYLIDDNKLPGKDITNEAIKLIPNGPALYNSDGTLNWEMYNGFETWSNPLAYLKEKYSNKTTNLVSNIILSYELMKGLQVKSSFGYNKAQSNLTNFFPQIVFGPTFPVNLRSAAYVTSNTDSWIIEPQLNYQFGRNFGKFEFLLGSTLQETGNNQFSIGAGGFQDDAQLENISFATYIRSVADQSSYNYSALFGKLNYNYQDKYILNFSVRRDGSSRFGPGNLFHDFYSLAGAWIFSKEKWFGEHLSSLSYGKLKLSYGTTGSDQIGEYQFMSLYNSYNPGSGSYGGGKGLKPAGLSNPYLQWEETRKLNLGLDIGLLNDRILLNINYYRNRSSNQLLSYKLPVITGFYGIRQNFNAKVQNSGFEVAINSVNVKSKYFNWTTALNLSLNRNKLVEFPNLQSSSYANLLVIGQPITISKVYSFAGVNQQTGVYQFRKSDGTLTSTSLVYPVDQNEIIDLTPEYFGGISNSFSYKGFSLDILFQFSKQAGRDPSLLGVVYPGYFSAANYNQPVAVANHWRQPGDISTVQRLSTQDNVVFTAYDLANFYSNAIIVNTSYLRLKNISFSWTVPGSWIKRARMQNLRLYCQGQNLFTITPYKGLDPETASLAFTLPPLRTITFGLQATF